ncbi:WD40 repeat-like protein [Leucogyrophana mollusca]|uniref:WD40 repeat-like protein n=1 Tax=Leucogyrophana mollusca TaxID=85980 RepID=A0ACB8BHB3_9AGAM|nr:WD40 repeat-like protein [Leucogyrophana mollusca]
MSSPAELSSSVERTSSHPPTKVFKGHTHFVDSVAYFPDGRHIASGSDDKTIRIWNVETGKQEGETLEHDSEVRAIAIAPDGATIAGRVVGGLIVWDVVTRNRVRAVKLDGELDRAAYALMVAFSPDCRCIATASSMGTSIQLWDVDTGSLVRELQQHVDMVWCLSFSPDGVRIATGSPRGSFRVFDTSTGKTVVGPTRGHADAVTSLVYSPDSCLLVTGSDDGSIRTWDAATGWEVGSPILLPGSAIRGIVISADGKRIAITSADHTVRLWNLETRLQIGDLYASRASSWTRSVAFSPNGRFVIIGGGRDVELWDTAAVLDSAPSPPITGNREPSRSIVPSAHVITHPPPFLQQKQAPSKTRRDTSSLSSSILDLPAVVQPTPERAKQGQRAPSIDDWDSFQSHRQPTAEPTKTQQEPRAELGNLNTPPSAPDSRWARIIRRPWRHLLSRKPHAHIETPQDSPHSPPEEHPTPRKHPDPSPATDPSAISTRGDHTGDEAHVRNPDAQKQFPVRFWDRLRRSGASRHKSRPRGQKQPTPGVVDVAGGRDKRLIMSPDTEEYGVPPAEPVELPPIASRPPSFFEIEVDPSKGWSWSRELCELICCYWCFPRNQRPG